MRSLHLIVIAALHCGGCAGAVVTESTPAERYAFTGASVVLVAIARPSRATSAWRTTT